MPTGYTCKLVDEGQTFEEFVWTCARAMGAFVHMREDTLSSLPYVTEEPFFASYSRERIPILREKIEFTKGMSHEKIKSEAVSRYNRELLTYQEHLKRQEVIKARLEKMLEQVENWKVPSPEHLEFKWFMFEQLKDTLRCDCYLWPEPKLDLDTEAWRKQELEKLERDLAWSQEDYAKALKSHHEYVQWIRDLADSVKPPYEIKGL